MALQNHVIDSDEPVSLGGEGLAPDPRELMLAAFNACMTAVFVQEARAKVSPLPSDNPYYIGAIYE
ncbi:OsmC family protein [Citrobacter sp. FDAARGOS_156]|uniref:OsmC family protein n=1 Tax=Citrobacter sp. FDAARGOS_156 TaxID=1702170 RepID=UPI001F2BFBC5|nr:hypothetical protein [Citrobacter sp. FDAARGOS_156]